MTTNNETELFRSVYTGSYESLQQAITLLKLSGFSQGQSVMCIVKELKISLKQADEIILDSDAWAQNKEANLKFRDDLYDFLKQ